MGDADEDAVLRRNHAIERLALVLDEPGMRKTFADDPDTALRKAGVSRDDVPTDLVDTLASLTPEEWEVLDKVKAPLKEVGALEHGVTFL